MMMMRWGRRKSTSPPPPPSSFTRPSAISRFFPSSWLSSSSKNKEEKKGKKKSDSQREGIFYAGEDDPFWRLSFRDNGLEEETSRVDFKSVWYDSDDELTHSVMNWYDSSPGREEKQIRMLKKRAIEDQKAKQRDFERNWEESDKAEEKFVIPMEKDILELQPRKEIQPTEKNFPKSAISDSRKCYQLGTVEEGCVIEKQRKSAYKVRVSSPRSATKIECKIRPLEDMKKSKLKKKKKKERVVAESAPFENFAVVKCSADPQQDFRDSMVEMITEKGIRQPEDLEELLACYLTLNSDEYHDLIIKVFRQVWVHLEEANKMNIVV